ncbi:copper amine oxidase N-terminal domain-containing protein [Marinicrinis lubricantis]|uniref:Copper amine oxidase N-terminal domain-containing protein n=1 Tax=Marinicrinis lubricantis TaxID=2086470 RepID=A0ABW1IQ82_9BACL
MKVRKRIIAMLSAALFTASCIPSTLHSVVHAADSSFISKIAQEYEDFFRTTDDAYQTYLREQTKLYQQFLDQHRLEFKSIHDQLNDDLRQMSITLEADILELENTYGSRNDKLRAYRQAANKNSIGSAMDLYEDIIDKNSIGSPMDQYEDAIDPNTIGSAMDQYEDAVDPNSIGSAMDQYEDAVDPNSIGSPMDQFEDASDIHSIGSIMDQYEDGDITKPQAEQQMKQAKQNAVSAIESVKNNTTTMIENTRSRSAADILNKKTMLIQSALQQRKLTIQTLSDLRKNLTGTGITFPDFVIATNEIKVMIDGELQQYEQPPVAKGGYVLVPMRDIFERLGAEIEWNNKEQSVTAKKDSTTIYLKIGSKEAQINGAAQQLETEAQLVNQKTMVPLRFVSEALSAEVKWDGSTKTVYINTQTAEELTTE